MSEIATILRNTVIAWYGDWRQMSFELNNFWDQTQVGDFDAGFCQLCR